MNNHNDRHMANTGNTATTFPGQQIASLGDRLARRPPNRSNDGKPTDTSASSEQKSTAEESPPPKTTESVDTARPTTGRPDATHATTRNVALSLDIVTRDALRKTARRTRASQAEVIYQALEQYVADGRKASNSEVNPGGLFQRHTATGAGSKSVHTLRLPIYNLEVIDDLVNQTGHPNRSALVGEALNSHLDVEPSKSTVSVQSR